jgi:hypothetical protein
MESAKLSVM